MRIGFMRLIDAAPLVVAAANGYFDDEGVAVEIEREGGWMIVRDKLTYGLLDASHSLLGMSIMSQLGRSDFMERDYVDESQELGVRSLESLCLCRVSGTKLQDTDFLACDPDAVRHYPSAARRFHVERIDTLRNIRDGRTCVVS